MLNKKPKTPYYLIDENKLLNNMKIIQQLREESGAKSLLALKCFSTWCVFPLMRKYMDGTTSSSLYEARLGHEEFGGETHAYSVAYSEDEIPFLAKFADKMIFNSASQLEAFYKTSKKAKIGVRVNPGISYSNFDLADPARKYSRLGIADTKTLRRVLPKISGMMFHFNCENDDFKNFSKSLDFIGEKFAPILKKVEWISLGGGIYFTKNGYPVSCLCEKLKNFSKKYGVQIYLEPGESSITNSTELVTTVIDVVHNKMDIAIVDASIEAHMLDLLTYRLSAKIAYPTQGRHKVIIAGRSCLAGDVFGSYSIHKKLKVGDQVRFADAAGYTMVKKNWFNGVPMPSIVVKRLDGRIETVRRFSYDEFKKSLS
ncbi:MAG TPA: carboxynorspermidine decarboxylase [Victivallales bacterium]|nr:carboxynorspermidine decarboxylase [Victivallales bacterium]